MQAAHCLRGVVSSAYRMLVILFPFNVREVVVAIFLIITSA